MKADKNGSRRKSGESEGGGGHGDGSRVQEREKQGRGEAGLPYHIVKTTLEKLFNRSN